MAGSALVWAVLITVWAWGPGISTRSRMLPALSGVTPSPAARPSASPGGASAGRTGRPGRAGGPLSAIASDSPVLAVSADTSETASEAMWEAVVRRYYAALDQLPSDMDPRPLAVLFAPGCACRAQLRAVRRARRRGEHYVDQVDINALVPSRDGPGSADVLADVRASRGGLVSASGQRLTSVPAKRHLRRVFRLVRRRGSWQIAAIEAV
jgi:hypothetical protein